ILCIAASDRADELIAKLFEAVLLERGMNPYVTRAREGLEVELPERTMAIVVSALPPEAVPAARAVCKRLHAVVGTVPVCVGLWCATGDLERSRQRLEAAGAQSVVTTLSECCRMLEIERERTRLGIGQPDPPADTDEPLEGSVSHPVITP